MAKGKSKQKMKRQKAAFCLRSSQAKEVILMGDFNQWDPVAHPMKKDKKGVWKKHVFLHPGTYEYKFMVDGEWWTDPENPLTCPNTFGTLNNLVVIH